MVRAERFELITRLILSQPPLPIGLHAQTKVGAVGRIRTFNYTALNRARLPIAPRQHVYEPQRKTKTDEGREKQAANTLRGTLLLRMANSRTLQKHRVHHPSKAPCLHLAKKVTSIVKKLKERAFNFP